METDGPRWLETTWGQHRKKHLSPRLDVKLGELGDRWHGQRVCIEALVNFTLSQTQPGPGSDLFYFKAYFIIVNNVGMYVSKYVVCVSTLYKGVCVVCIYMCMYVVCMYEHRGTVPLEVRDWVPWSWSCPWLRAA